jgi:flagellar biosynthesis/type III secretory pathway chaperone
MKLIAAIKNVLGEEVHGCRQLLEILQREKICLLDLQMEEVEAIVKEKDILVLKLRLLEEERKRLLDRFIRGTPFPHSMDQKDGPKPTLLDLAEITGENSFKDVRSKLISLSQSINELNDLNRTMIDRTLGFLKKNNNLLGPLYWGGKPLEEKGGLLSKEM